jgi:hypothetical protein
MPPHHLGDVLAVEAVTKLMLGDTEGAAALACEADGGDGAVPDLAAYRHLGQLE